MRTLTCSDVKIDPCTSFVGTQVWYSQYTYKRKVLYGKHYWYIGCLLGIYLHCYMGEGQKRL
jgi:hypothetical protein